MKSDEDGPTGMSSTLIARELIHELRHPIMGMKSGLHYVEKTLPPATVSSEDWQLVKNQLVQMEALCRRYQTFLQPELAQPLPFAPGPAVQAAVDVVKFQLRKLGEAFTVVIPPDAPLALGTDVILTHAITNLLSNALAAMNKSGGRRLSVRLAPSGDGKLVTVRVSDEGSGITPDVARRLFESGFTTKTEAEGGTGLGLKLARRLLAAQGAKLRLVEEGDPERAPWAVTEFVVELPTAPAPAKVEPPQRAAPVQKRAEPRTLLLVDDQPVILQMLARAAAADGYVVTTASTGDEAEALLRARRFDVLVTDKNLPGKNGLELALLARAEHGADMTIFLITAYATVESARVMLKLGADAYIEKPFELEDLMRRLRTIADAKAARPKVAALEAAPVDPVVHVSGLPGRVAVCDSDVTDSGRIGTTLAAMGVDVVSTSDVVRALETEPAPGGVVVATALLTEPVRHLLWLTKLKRPKFRVVVICEEDSLKECITAVSVGATGELMRPLNPGELPEALLRALATNGKRT